MQHRITPIGATLLLWFGALLAAPSAAASAPSAAASTPAPAAQLPVATPNTAPGCAASGTPGNWSITYTANRYCTYTAIRAWTTCEWTGATRYGAWVYAGGHSKATCNPYDGGVWYYGYDYSN